MHRLRSFLSALRPTRLGVLFAVLIGFGVGFWQWGQPPRPRVVLENLVGDFQAFFSPDGQTLAICQDSDPRRFVCHYLSLWDVVTGQKKLDLFKDKALRGLDFSPDGRTLACLLPDRSIVAWNLADGRVMATYEEPTGTQLLVFSQTGKLMAMARGALRRGFDLWDVADNRIVKNLVLDDERIIGTGALLVLAKAEDIVKIWDLENSTIRAELKASEFPDHWLNEGVWTEFSSDREFLIGHGPPMLVFDLSKKKKIMEISTQNFQGTCGIAIAPDGKTAALGIWNSPERATGWSWFAS